MNDSPERKTVIEVRKAVRHFRDVRAVDGVDLAIRKGEFVALLGPNGAGKTTLVEMIEGIQHPDSGTIRLFERNWHGNEKWIRARIGLCLQETHFMEKLTVEEVVDLFGSFYGERRRTTDEILHFVGLVSKRRSYTMNLSGGQRQKLALGVALINRPDILILDEPTTGLDPAARHEIWNILLQLKREGTTMILTTHYMEEAEVLCDRILFMYDGRIIRGGTKEELIQQSGGADVIEFSASPLPPAFSEREIRGFLKYDRDEKEGRGRLSVKDMKEALPDFFRAMEEGGAKMDNLSCRGMTLDDLFIELTGRSLRESENGEAKR